MITLFYIVLLFNFLSGSFKEYLGLQEEFCELIIICLLSWMFFCNLYDQKIKLHLSIVIWGVLYIAWALFSCLVNQLPVSCFFLYARHMFTILLLYGVFSCLDFSGKEKRRLLKLIVGLCLLQIFISALNLMIYGAQEFRVGTIYYGGGGMANNFMIAMTGYATGWYYFTRKSWRNLLWVMGFALVGVASGKRSTVVIYPIFVFLSLLICALLAQQNKNKRYWRLLDMVLIFLAITACLLSYLPKLGGFSKQNYENFSERIEWVIEYTAEYENRGFDTNFNTTFGRYANSELMWNLLTGKYPFNDFWTGVGPMMASKRYDWAARTKYGFGYGISGWTDEILSVGVVGLLLGFLFNLTFIIKMISCNRFQQLVPCGQAIYVGNLVFFLSYLFVHFSYNSLFVDSSLLQVVYIIGCSMLITPSWRSFFYSASPVFTEKNDRSEIGCGTT